MIEKFLNSPINFLELRNKHRTINDAGKYLQAQLILLQPNEKAEGFDDLIDELVLLFDRYCPDVTIRGEEKLRRVIQTIFVEMKDRYHLETYFGWEVYDQKY